MDQRHERMSGRERDVRGCIGEREREGTTKQRAIQKQLHKK